MVARTPVLVNARTPVFCKELGMLNPKTMRYKRNPATRNGTMANKCLNIVMEKRIVAYSVILYIYIHYALITVLIICRPKQDLDLLCYPKVLNWSKVESCFIRVWTQRGKFRGDNPMPYLT